MIYLDNSATTKPCSEAVEAMTAALVSNWGNPSALYGFGFESAKLLREARHKVAAALGAEPDRVFFTSGGTEADNWAVFSTAKRFGKKKKHIITTAIEHHAILNCMHELESQGFEVTYLQPDGEGRITLDSLKAALRPDTILVSIMMVNNEAGSVMPIAQMAKLTHKLCPNAIFLFEESLRRQDPRCGPDLHLLPQGPRTQGCRRPLYLPPLKVLPRSADRRRSGGQFPLRHRGNPRHFRLRRRL